MIKQTNGGIMVWRNARETINWPQKINNLLQREAKAGMAAFLADPRWLIFDNQLIVLMIKKHMEAV